MSLTTLCCELINYILVKLFKSDFNPHRSRNKAANIRYVYRDFLMINVHRCIVYSNVYYWFTCTKNTFLWCEGKILEQTVSQNLCPSHLCDSQYWCLIFNIHHRPLLTITNPILAVAHQLRSIYWCKLETVWPHWLSVMDKNSWVIILIHYFVFRRRKEIIRVWNDMSKWWLVEWTLLVREAWIVQNNQYSTLMQMPVHDITSCVQGTQDLQYAKFLVVLIEPQDVFDWPIISGWQQCNPFTFLLSAGMLYFSANIRRKSHSKQFLNRIQINHSSKSHPAKEKSNTRGTFRGPAIN